MGSVMIDQGYADVGEIDTAMISLRMPSGILCQLDFCWRAAYGQDERIEVRGSEGMLQTQQAPTSPLLHFGAGGMTQAGKMPTWQQRFLPTYRAELDAFVHAIETGECGGLPGLACGLAAQQIADAAKQSVIERRIVQLS